MSWMSVLAKKNENTEKRTKTTIYWKANEYQK